MIVPALVAGFLFGCAAPEVPQAPGAVAGVAACRAGFAWEAWAADVEARNPGIRRTEMDAEARRVFLRNYNAIPPATAHDPAHVWAFAVPSGRAVLVALVDDGGCVAAADQVPIGIFVQLMTPAGQGT